MKKLTKVLVVMMALLMVFSTAVACGTNSTNSSSSSESSDVPAATKTVYGVEMLDTKYVPNTSSITKLPADTINIIWKAGTLEPGYQAVIDAYKQAQPNINVVFENQPSEGLELKINGYLTNNTAGLDIFNTQYNTTDGKTAYHTDLYPYINQQNPYTNSVWKDVLTSTAYTNTNGTTGTLYQLYSAMLATSWTYNLSALKAANEGLLKAGVDYKAIDSWTWADFITCLKVLKTEYGWSSPAIIGATYHEVYSNSWNWFERIYGDYLTREIVPYYCIQEGDAGYDEFVGTLIKDGYNGDMAKFLTDGYFNKNASYKYSAARTASIMFNKNDAHYDLLRSRFADFWDQVSMLFDYVPDAFAQIGSDGTTGMTQAAYLLRGGYDKTVSTVFYLGLSTGAVKIDNLLKDAPAEQKFEVSSCPWFRMGYRDGEATYKYWTKDERIMRSVGGSNEGWVVRYTENAAHLKSCIDFVQFWMSPVGQQAYFNGLQKANIAPDGPTTLDQSLLNLPSAWKAAVEYNGGASSSYLTRFFYGNLDGATTAVNQVAWQKKQNLIINWFNGYRVIKTYKNISDGWKDFSAGWITQLETNLGITDPELAGCTIQNKKYKTDFYLHPEQNPVA